MSKSREARVKFYNESNNIDMLDQIEPIITEYANKIGEKIHVSCPHGRGEEPYSGTTYGLKILFWAIPNDLYGFVRSGVIRTAYGLNTKGGQRDCFKMAPDSDYDLGEKIIDNDGNVLALIVKKSLFVLFDLPHSDGRISGNHAVDILRRILLDYELFRSDKLSFDSRMRRRLNKSRGSNLSKVIKGVFKSGVKSNIEIIEREIEQTKDLLQDEVSKRKSLLLGINDPIAFRGEFDESEMYQRLCKVSVTGKIEMFNQTVNIPVGQIDIKDGRVVRDIGYFVVLINLQQHNFYQGVKCINMTRVLDGYHHPHIDDDGDMCLGSVDDVVERLYYSGQLDLMVLVIKDFLRSYYEAGCYKDLLDWPRKKVKKKARCEDDG